MTLEPIPLDSGRWDWCGSDPLAATHLGRDCFRVDCTLGGLANLARVHGIRDGRNTVLARATIYSDRIRRSRMEFGFSDRAVVYLNRRPLYRGDDGYRSRDYRFLGSIGWWDSLYLDLVPGENELAIAVSEDFDSWGIQARFPDATGLSYND